MQYLSVEEKKFLDDYTKLIHNYENNLGNEYIFDLTKVNKN